MARARNKKVPSYRRRKPKTSLPKGLTTIRKRYSEGAVKSTWERMKRG